MHISLIRFLICSSLLALLAYKQISFAETIVQDTPPLATPITAAKEAPNILLVLTDDVGFSAASTFGGSIPTPNLDRLAEQGLRYNQFHTVGVCSPTRASLLTGRNHHAVGYGTVPEAPSPYPGYTARIPDSATTIARVLRDNGYSTAMFGKEHNVPTDDRSHAGPFDQWPTGRGFEYFYGFVSADSHQWQPALHEGITPVLNRHKKNYLLDEELADKTINWIHNQKAAAPEKPFFIYYSTGTAHAPHHAPQSWIEKFKGRFDHGWDEERNIILARQKQMGIVPKTTQLASRPHNIAAWNTLSQSQKNVYARYMEVFAGMLAYQDAQFGRIMNEIERMGIAENTLVLFIQGDNGASGEGGPDGSLNEIASLGMGIKGHDVDTDWLENHLDILGSAETYQAFPVGWAYATSTPFPWIKQLASHLGGVRNGMVVSWPNKIKTQGELRNQYHHVIDVMPTLLEAASIQAPNTVDGVKQQRIDGSSMVYSFSNKAAKSTRTTQYYEVFGNRAIFHNGWLASTTPRNMPWEVAQDRQSSDVDSYPWELYNLETDFSQSTNIADKHADKLNTLKALFNKEARDNNVYPVHDTGAAVRVMQMQALKKTKRPTQFTYWGRDIKLPTESAPPIFYLPFTIEAHIEIPEQGASGVILAAGSHFGGWSFYMDKNKLIAASARSPLKHDKNIIKTNTALKPGKHIIQFEFSISGKDSGSMAISANGTLMAQSKIIKRPLLQAGLGESFDIGRDSNIPVSDDYKDEGVFTGHIEKVIVYPKWPKYLTTASK